MWETYELASTQWRTGFGGRESLDIKAVLPIAQKVEIDLDELDIRKLNLISYFIVSDDIARTESKK